MIKKSSILIYLSVYLSICLSVSLNGQVLNNQEIDKGTGVQRNTSFNVDEIKVRWKKAALENCPGVPCIPFTCGYSMLTDVDGNIYNTVAIGTQCWTKENLKVTRYNDGTSIPLDASGTSTGTVSQIWSTRREGAYTIYGNEPGTGTNATNYGYIYNWYAASGIVTAGGTSTKNICPTGYHVPTDTEWTVLETHLGGSSVAGGKMKQIGTSLWNTPNINADNTSGFTGLPGGCRHNNGLFSDIRVLAFFWSATEDGGSDAWFRLLNTYNGSVGRTKEVMWFGASVRCLRD